MTTDFLTEDFLLENEPARELYHSYAKACPIVDFHNHLSVSDMCADRRYPDIGTLWVCSDPYKHRAMRLYGLDERVISGKASPKQKFQVWCEVLPYTVGNPLFHWSCMEMKRFFGIDVIPQGKEIGRIWAECNSQLQQDDHTMNAMLRQAGVVQATTSDDLLDDVSLHENASRVSGIHITPSLRADSILTMKAAWFERLGCPVGLDGFLEAVSERMDAFDGSGCRLSDHSLDNGFKFIRTPKERARKLFLHRESLDGKERLELSSFLLEWLAGQYARRAWVMQLHIGAERWTSSTLRNVAGAAGGYASLGSCADIRSVCDFLDACDSEGLLPKTILYTLNPADNAAFATLTGSFSESGVQKIKLGPAWWYNDHIYGIEENLEVLSSYSLLSQFPGMTTDSRNVLSFSRHEYFRRILCNHIGTKVHKKQLPPDMEFLGSIVENICFRNAESWIYREH